MEELSSIVQVSGALICGSFAYAKSSDLSGIDVLLICESYPDGLRTRLETIEHVEFRILFVDRNLMESDIYSSALGDFLSEKLLYPYVAITSLDYVEKLSHAVKVRIVREEARDLVIEYGEMSRGLVAKPEFFGLSRMRTRARVFIPSMSEYLRFFDDDVRSRNLSTLREAYKKAVLTLQGDVVVLEGEDNVILTDATVDRWLKDRASKQVVNILEQGRKAFYSYVARGRAIFLNSDLLAREIYGPIRLGLNNEMFGKHPQDPKDYLYIRTSTGLTPINERTSIEEIVSKLRPGRPITISPLAGVLNEVFLVASGKDRFVAKKFTNWHGFKWFTLNLVSFGSKLFVVSGKARMTNEYGINRYLAKKRLNVPEIIHVSLSDRLLLESFVPGNPLDQFVGKVVNEPSLTSSQTRVVESLGKTLALIHSAGVSIGDSKPENFVSENGNIYVVDLEQAGKHGDFAWDIAELLFYAGHYSRSPTPSGALTDTTEAFIEGYSREGDPAELRRAASIRYAKVFSIWTSAPILLEISKMLREAR